MLIRQIQLDDAARFLELCQQLDAETSFMMLEPDERHISVEQQHSTIKHALDNQRSMIFVVDEGRRLIG